MDSLKRLTSQRALGVPRLRVISTSYMGATDPRAIEALLELPNTEVRISYDTKRTRLHAKSYLIHRETGFGSAYVGSANISHAALSEGLEWTSKLSQYELPYLWQKVGATFETYWNDPDFEALDSSQMPRLRRALAHESGGTADDSTPAFFFDLAPYPYQEEILDALAVEREVTGKRRQLIVAATGTGKTMIAAFDYRRWAIGNRPRLLFIAHRKEILIQALATFRQVLRDHNFGELLVDGEEPCEGTHLFCSIQSYQSRFLFNQPSDYYEYIVVDEFHHAEAASYRILLEHANPEILLGLTATPERADGKNVLDWFGGAATAEVRLPDAINRRLLSPFHYFGISDSADLSQLRWERGGYRTSDLENVYTGDSIRAQLVVDKVSEILTDVKQARGLGFCVSVKHAAFMTDFFNERGIPSLTLTAQSTSEVRRSARNQLVARRVNFIFVVDLYNEGVDIPEIDTVLFLRPTESLTVYLQQLGRGLRLHDQKECLTVLDFIGAHRKEFRFAPRLRALSSNPTAKLEVELQAGFPHLPSGCVIQLERVAKANVLSNIKQSLHRQRPQLVSDLRALSAHLGRPPRLHEALESLDMEVEQLLKRGLWSRLLHDANALPDVVAPDEERLTAGLRRLCCIDDPNQIAFLLDFFTDETEAELTNEQQIRLTMLHVTMWGRDETSMTIEEANQRLFANRSVCSDIVELLKFRLARTRTRPSHKIERAGPLTLHAQYSGGEILAGLGYWEMQKRAQFREGVLHLPDIKRDVFFITLHKTEESYSPTTMYEDYAICDRRFHWQSQNTTSVESPTGQRYIRHRELGYAPLLFVREHKKLPSGDTAPYVFLGSARYDSHEGSRPMSIIWSLDFPMPARIQAWTKTA